MRRACPRCGGKSVLELAKRNGGAARFATCDRCKHFFVLMPAARG